MKKFVLMCAPFTSRSGYGDHARSIFYALYQSKKYEIKVLDVRWGDTPRNFLQKDNLAHKSIISAIVNPTQITKQPDIYIDIRIPNEFESPGRYNIGITAGIETNVVSVKWLEGCNKMDLIIVPSNHSNEGFVKAIYDKMQNLPDGKQQKIGEVKIEKPIEVVFEGADETIFKFLKVDEISRKILKEINDIVKEDFAFLFVGQWNTGGYGEDRKDIAKLIKVFIETFANKKKQPALILKTNGATFSIIDREMILKKIKATQERFPQGWSLPNIYLLHGDLTDDEMNDLYNHPKIKCMISFTHGEGFGRPLLEASMVGLPIIVSGWSGHVDFLDDKYTQFINGKLQQVPKSVVWKDIIIPESKWFVIDEHHAYLALKHAYENRNEIKEKAKKMMRKNRKKYTLNKMIEFLNEIVDKYTMHLSSSTQLKLPKLKKIRKNESQEIKLPKLKKVT